MLNRINIRVIEYRVKVQTVRAAITDIRMALSGLSTLGIETDKAEHYLMVAINVCTTVDRMLLIVQDVSYRGENDGLPF